MLFTIMLSLNHLSGFSVIKHQEPPPPPPLVAPCSDGTLQTNMDSFCMSQMRSIQKYCYKTQSHLLCESIHVLASTVCSICILGTFIQIYSVFD